MGPQKLKLVLAGHESVGYPRNGCFPRHPLIWPRQPILADEVQTFKALITVHKVLQEGHPIVLKEAQGNVNWIESLARGAAAGEGLRGRLHEP